MATDDGGVTKFHPRLIGGVANFTYAFENVGGKFCTIFEAPLPIKMICPKEN